MYKCPHCSQDLESFALFCIRCSRKIGLVEIDGVMLALWWLDKGGTPVKKAGTKALKLGGTPVDAKSLEFVSEPEGEPYVLITLRHDGQPRRIETRDFFREATNNQTQELKI